MVWRKSASTQYSTVGCEAPSTHTLSQDPVATTPCPLMSTHRTHRTGASCAAIWLDWPVATSNTRPALSAPPLMTLVPSCEVKLG